MTSPEDRDRIVPRSKPPGVGHEAWADRLIREAEKAGAFDNLPGAGKPIPNLESPYDEDWWIKEKLKREDLSVAPPVLRARQKIDELREALPSSPSEALLRERVGELQVAIEKANAMALPPGAKLLPPIDEAKELSRWHAYRSERGTDT